MIELRTVLDERLDSVLGSTRSCALYGYPDHSNAGDSAIWLGQLSYLADRGVDVVYSCSRATYCAECLEQSVGDGVLLVHGGGWLGDVWPGTVEQWIGLLGRHRNNRIVALPQTIHFARDENAWRVGQAIADHGDVTVMVRDHVSFERAKAQLGVMAVLSPDMAVRLKLEDTSRPRADVVYLKRTDLESGTQGSEVEVGGDVLSADWLGQSRSSLIGRVAYSGLARANTQLRRLLAAERTSRPVFENLASRVRNMLATQRLAVGLETLQQGRVVVTDRLHGHILSLVLGKPCVALDNSYGKVSSFFRSWTSELPASYWADSPSEALNIARRLALS